MPLTFAQYIPWLPALAAVLCGLCATRKSLRGLAAPICILTIFAGFVITLGVAPGVYRAQGDSPLHNVVGPLFEWIHVGDFQVDFSYYFDGLTIVMLCVVTGIGTLVAIYAAGYMKGDRGYARFFAFVGLFIFAMTTLVMADNLVLLYLGWEGVGLCSYLLIGYYYQKPSAVAAAKKAFIVNRVGDLGFALGLMLTYLVFHTVHFNAILPAARSMLHSGGAVAPAAADALVRAGNANALHPLWLTVIPFLLMLGAFGKSAQLPLYVWLPDAMEGPTPVSALIHAATMVTAGVYMIARLLPIFQLSEYALPVVAVVGGATALFAATIALCQYDIKRIYAYSTISQLGYMFLGVGALSTVGGIFHLFTHAFFKALLFLTAGSVMHALSGQLDLRKMSGLRRKMPVTCWLMFAGCLALAGFPFTAGFFSKDMILGDAMERGVVEHRPLFVLLSLVGLFTAFLTAFYTFRLWFRVFMGPTKYEMGTDSHGDEEDAHTHGSAPRSAPGSGHGGNQASHAPHDAHEVSWLMNAPLVVLAAGALLAGVLARGWITGSIAASSAAAAEPAGEAPQLMGLPLHQAMQIISGLIAILGIGMAAYYHWLNRPAADAMALRHRGIVRVLANKYYVDELYDAVIVRPLRTTGEIFFAIDRLIIDGLVSVIGFIPRMLGLAVQPAQAGLLQGYGLGMVACAAILVLLVICLGG